MTRRGRYCAILHQVNRIDSSLSMVTVFFEAELGLARLQARSLDALGGATNFARIVVIDNTHRGISRQVKNRLLADFGQFRTRVVFVRPADLVDLPTAPGWMAQQVLKLMAYQMVDTSHYVVLDAKNHWIQTTDSSTFIGQDGRARGASHTYRGHALESRVAEVMRYLGVDPDGWIDHFLVTHTPVVMETSVVAELVEGIEARSGRAFAVEFLERDLLEFPLYASWIIANHGELKGHIDGSVVRSTTIWPSADSSSSSPP